MTATDRLRRLLDERGVKHYDGTECTYWGYTVLARSDGSFPIYRFSATEVTDGVSVHLLRVSPEQAVEATLGRGTCKVVSKPCDMWECECGKAWWHGGAPNYCPSCGRVVVE